MNYKKKSREDIIRIASWYNKRKDRISDIGDKEMNEIAPIIKQLIIEAYDSNLYDFAINCGIAIEGKKSQKKCNSDWKLYLSRSRAMTKITSNSMLDGFIPVTKRSHLQSDSHFVVDHKYSIFHGFKHGVPIEEICDRRNMSVISARQNSIKGTRITIDKDNKHLEKYIPIGFDKYYVTS